jgi:hypothetical protein
LLVEAVGTTAAATVVLGAGPVRVPVPIDAPPVLAGGAFPFPVRAPATVALAGAYVLMTVGPDVAVVATFPPREALATVGVATAIAVVVGAAFTAETAEAVVGAAFTAAAGAVVVDDVGI